MRHKARKTQHTQINCKIKHLATKIKFGRLNFCYILIYFSPNTQKSHLFNTQSLKTKKIGSTNRHSRQCRISDKRLLPTQSRSTEHCSIGTRKARLKNLHLVFPERYNLFVHACANGRKQKFAGICKTAKEDNCLRH